MLRPWLALCVGCAESGPSAWDEPGALDGAVIGPYLPDPEPIRSVPVYGGTLETAAGIGGVVAADPQGNRLLRVVGDEVVAIDLGENARPFRLHVEDTRAWVTLRGTGELASVALDSGGVTWRTRVCLEPRGVARSPSGPLVVACAGGELVEVSDDGELMRLVVLDPDLRDVAAFGDALVVSRFASAHLLRIDPPTLTERLRITLGPDARVAWRMRVQDERLMVLHQARTLDLVELVDPGDEGEDEEASYGGGTGCAGRTVDTVLTELLTPLTTQSTTLENVTLGTDFVLIEDNQVAVADAGVAEDAVGILRFDLHLQRTCATANLDRVLSTAGRPSALALDPQGDLILQSASPLSITRAEEDGGLLTERADASAPEVALFHAATDAGISCASCHPEGLDDGHVWVFFSDEVAPFPRRTMSLAGMIRSRLPYHWDALHEDPDELMADTFVSRMGGIADAGATASLFDWLDGLRHVRSHPGAPESVLERGRAAFAKAECDACHVGAVFTNNEVASIGRATEAVKVPSLLGVGVREPLLHDGCYPDLGSRFEGGCGVWGDTHGSLGALSHEEIDALEAFVRTL
jgi:hypothetical protein